MSLSEYVAGMGLVMSPMAKLQQDYPRRLLKKSNPCCYLLSLLVSYFLWGVIEVYDVARGDRGLNPS